jgi:RecA/RadA recombinase
MSKDVLTAEKQIENFLNDKKNKDYHYNHLKAEEYKISSGSLNLDLAMDGGLGCGIHRFTGINEGGKTSCALSFAKHFQDHFGDNGKIVYFKAEGRLSEDIIKRSGINTDERVWCVIACNVFEKVFDLIRDLVEKNDEKRKYMFIIDSMDGLCRLADVKKAFADAELVAGGSLISSVFLKKQSLPIAMNGHMAIITSQVRIEIPSGFSKMGARPKSSGGHAVKHYSNNILEFEERYNSDIFWENPDAETVDKKGNPIGHMCKIAFKKSVNEKTGARVKYPIKYGRTNGNSVWVEKELIDMMTLWGYFEKSGAWIKFSEDIYEKYKDLGLPEKVQGQPKLLKLIEENKELAAALVKEFKQDILKS